MTYTYLLLDADDTLFDFQLAQERSLNEVFQKVGIPLEHKKTYKEISHGLWAQLEKKEITLEELKASRFKLLLKRINYKTNDDVEMLYENTLATHDELLEGAIDFLETISKNYHLVLISNGMPNIQHPRLKSSNIQKYFEEIFISDEIGAQKPSKEFFDIVFNKIKADKGDCLVIGDSLSSDILGGSNYGIDTCWINFEGKTNELPTYCCRSFDDIIDILKH